MTIPPITAFTGLTPPARTQQRDEFNDNVEAALGAWPDFQDEANAMAVAMDALAVQVDADAAAAAADRVTAQTAANGAVAATAYVATSTTSFSIGTGSKAFNIGTGKSFASGGGEDVVVRRKGDASVRLYGATTSYSSGTLTINVTRVVGSGGPYTDWIVYLKAFFVDELDLQAQAIAFASAL